MTPLSAFAEFRAPVDWQRIDFISDLHLCESAPRTFDRFVSYLHETPADAVLILGDLFDAWIGDDVRFGGFERQCTDVLAQASRRLRGVGLMVGNRDFLVGSAFLHDCGVMALADPTVVDAFGERVLLTHGDSLCLADTDYQHFRSVVRRADWRAEFLARPLAERRDAARRLREQSELRKHGERGGTDRVDVDLPAALIWLQAANAPTMIHGHTHRPGSERLAAGYTRHVLSDWDLDSLGIPPRAEVLRWEAPGFRRETLVPGRLAA